MSTAAWIMPVILKDIGKSLKALEMHDTYIFGPSPFYSPVNDGAPDDWSQCLTLLVMTMQLSPTCFAYRTTTDRERIGNDGVTTLRRWPDVNVDSTCARDWCSSEKSREESGDQNGLNIFRACSAKGHHHGDEERYKYRPFSPIHLG